MEEFPAEHYGASGAPTVSATSIFDPVFCEIAYRRFCSPGGTVLDPFAGGSVRGIVALRLGRRHVSIELRAEQAAVNCAQLCRDVPLLRAARAVPAIQQAACTQTGGTALVITVLVGEQVAISTEGVYELPKLASAVIAAGARVSWDDTAK